MVLIDITSVPQQLGINSLKNGPRRAFGSGGNFTNQTFNCSLQWGLPAKKTIKSILGTTVRTINYVNDLNIIPAAVMNDALAAVLTVDTLVTQGLNVLSSQVTGSKWIDVGGHATLNFNLKTVSDPITANDIIALLIALTTFIIASVLIFVGVATDFLGDLIVGGLILAGVFIIIAVGVSLIGSTITSIAKSPEATLIAVGALALAGIGILAFTGVIGGKKPQNNTNRQAGE
jgi:hypothetical protein